MLWIGQDFEDEAPVEMASGLLRILSEGQNLREFSLTALIDIICARTHIS